MNFVITGHTSGIGKAIYEKYGGIGLSKSTGFDITVDNILPYVNSETVFINNAYTLQEPFAQVRLLYETYKLVNRVICIGSNTPYEGIYKTSKDALATACADLFAAGVNVTNLKFGKVDTPFQKLYNGSKISIITVVNTVDFVLSTPERIHEISIRP